MRDYNSCSTPWNAIEDTAAGAVSKLTRKYSLHAWDAAVSSNNHSQVVFKACGKDFLLAQNDELARDDKHTKNVIIATRDMLQSSNELARVSTSDFTRGSNGVLELFFLSDCIVMPNFLWRKSQRSELVTTTEATAAGQARVQIAT